MKVLFIRFSSIGDIILTTPVIKELKNKYPNAEIDFLTFAHFKDAITGNKNINKIIEFEKNKYKSIFGIKKFVLEKLKNENYDIIIDLHSKMRSKLVSFFLKKKIYRYNKRSLWKSIFVKLGLIKYTPDDTIVKRYFTAVKKLDVFYNGENIEFYYNEKDTAKVKKYENYVVLAPGASKETKKWPKEYFAEIAKMINEKYKKNILLVGSKKEYDELQYIKDNSGEFCINLAGELTLKESGALMAKSFFTLTNDSGPFHISRGVKAKTYVIFGATSPFMFDFEGNSILIYGYEKCSPCSLHGDKICPKNHFNCMKKLTPDKVFEIVSTMQNNLS